MRELIKEDVEKENIVMWSVLGTSAYGMAKYEFDDMDEKDKEFEDYYIQRIIYRYLRRKYPNIKLKLFLTEEAENRNWFQRSKNKNSETEDDKGLKGRLEEDCAVYDVIRIENGSDETEIWRNFNIFYNEARENDRIFVDITHSFRSIPIILLSVLGMAKHTKNIKLEQVYYGTYNTKTAINEKVISLGIYNQITEWSNSIAQFLATGSSMHMSDMTNLSYKKEIQKINISECRQPDYAYKEELKFLNALKELNEKIKDFSEKLLSVRGNLIISSAVEVIEKIKELETYKKETMDLNNTILPFYFIVSSIRPLFAKIDETNYEAMDDVRKLNAVIQMCLKFGLLQQGMTFLEENITNYLIIKSNHSDFKPDLQINDLSKKYTKTIREEVDQGFKVITGYQIDNEKKIFFSFNQKVIIDIRRIRENIKQFRNDMNHAGFNDTPSKYNKLMENLKEYLQEFEKVLDKNM